MIKCAEDPASVLRKANITKWLFTSSHGAPGEFLRTTPAWFIAGHTRAATRGKVNRQNAHPFRYGTIVGAHNGIIDAPMNYVVDSQYLFDTLNRAEGDYQKAWENIPGYWGISWFDGTSFYLQVHNGDLTVSKTLDGIYYYSSNWAHLEACIGYADKSLTLKEGDTLRFSMSPNGVIMERLNKFESQAKTLFTRYTNGYAMTGYDYSDDSTVFSPRKNYTATSPTTNNETHDYDAEWREAWESYSSGESEHAKIGS
jgi:predicted glutamine amidotransferase